MSHIIIQDSENGISVKVGSIFNGFFKKGVLLADSDANNKISITDTSSNTTICRNFPPAEIKTHLGATWAGDGRSAVDVKNALNLVINATPESFINSTDNLTALAGTTEADFNGSTGGKEGFTAVVGANDGEISTSGKLLFANHDNLKLGADLDVSIKKLYTTSVNGDITLEPNGTGDVNLGNYTLDGDQSVGSGQDNYVLTYDHSSAKISLESAPAGGFTGATDTDELTEGSTNLYFTDARVAANSAVTANTAKNSYPTADASKLAGIAAGAEVNVNADWNAASGDAQILNKPTIPSNTNLGNTNLTAEDNRTYDQDGNDLVINPNGGQFEINDSSGPPTGAEIVVGQGELQLQGLIYPASDGTNGQVLTTNGSGTLSFTTVSGGGGTPLASADQTLTADRTIDTNGHNLDIELDSSGTADTFTIHDGTHNLFQVDTTSGVDIPELNFYKGCISGKGGQSSQSTYGTQWRSSISGGSLGRHQTYSNNSILTFSSGTPSVGDTLNANNHAIATAYLLPGINFSKINLRGNIRGYDNNADGETQHMEVWTFDQTDVSGFGTTTCTFRGKISYTFDSTGATIRPILINSDISYSGDKNTGIIIVGHAPTNPSASYTTVFMIEVTVT